MESYKTQGQVEHTVHQTKIHAMEDKEQGREGVQGSNFKQRGPLGAGSIWAKTG